MRQSHHARSGIAYRSQTPDSVRLLERVSVALLTATNEQRSHGQIRPTLRMTGHSIGLDDRAFVGLIDAAGNERPYDLAEALAIAELIEPRSLRYIAEVLNFDTENGYLAADDAATWESHKARVSELLAGVEVNHG